MRGAPSLNKRTQLISKALRTSGWKARGAIFFLGIIGWNDELWLAGEHVARVIDRYVDAYDDLEHVTESTLGNVTHLRTPPSIHPRIRIHQGWPDLTDEVHSLVFVCIKPGCVGPLLSSPQKLFRGTMLVGTHEDLRTLAKVQKLKYTIVARQALTVAVRSVA